MSTDGLLWGMVIATPLAPLLLLLAVWPLIKINGGRHRK